MVGSPDRTDSTPESVPSVKAAHLDGLHRPDDSSDICPPADDEVQEIHRRPVGEDLFDWPPQTNGIAQLHGAKCKECREVVMPAILDCPSCMRPAVMLPVRLEGRGILRDAVVTERGPAGFVVPYIQGYIELEDGPRIYSMITGIEPTEAAILSCIGARMVIVIETIRHEGDFEIIGWKFRPEGKISA
jgi:uncharacterized OB-fold protein